MDTIKKIGIISGSNIFWVEVGKFTTVYPLAAVKGIYDYTNLDQPHYEIHFEDKTKAEIYAENRIVFYDEK